MNLQKQLVSSNAGQMQSQTRKNHLFKHFGSRQKLGFRQSLAIKASFGGYIQDINNSFISNLSVIGDIQNSVINGKLADNSYQAMEIGEKVDNTVFDGISDAFGLILKTINSGLEQANVPYSIGISIVILTVALKVITFPIMKAQVVSTLKIQDLQPQIKELQKKYNQEPDLLQKETAQLYRRANANPLVGCFPALVTIPVFFGIYNCLQNFANEGILQQPFFFIPNLDGPTSFVHTGQNMDWLLPFVDGKPPLGWTDTASYLVLPALITATQFVSFKAMQPRSEGESGGQKLLASLPLLIGYFSLNVPAGVSLYWIVNNILSISQQTYLHHIVAKRSHEEVQKAITDYNADVEANGVKETAFPIKRTATSFTKLQEQEKNQIEQQKNQQTFKQ